jgi:hypothetical protein
MVESGKAITLFRFGVQEIQKLRRARNALYNELFRDSFLAAGNQMKGEFGCFNPATFASTTASSA